MHMHIYVCVCMFIHIIYICVCVHLFIHSSNFNYLFNVLAFPWALELPYESLEFLPFVGFIKKQWVAGMSLSDISRTAVHVAQT